MRTPIAHALAFRSASGAGGQPLDLLCHRSAQLRAARPRAFPLPGLAWALAEEGGTPAVLNAANEVAVGCFLDGALGLTAFPR